MRRYNVSLRFGVHPDARITYRGVTNLASMYAYIDRTFPGWLYFNIYEWVKPSPHYGPFLTNWPKSRGPILTRYLNPSDYGYYRP